MSDQRRVVVIGSGPAGAMAARRARPAAGCRSTMLESGTSRPAGLLVRAGGPQPVPPRRRRSASPPRRSSPAAIPPPCGCFNLAPAGCRTSGPARCPASHRPTSPRASGSTSGTAGRSTTTTSRRSTPTPSGCSTSRRRADDVPALPAGCAGPPPTPPADWRASRPNGAERTARASPCCPLADGPPWLVARRGTAFNSYTQHRAAAARRRRTSSCAPAPTPCGSSGRARAAPGRGGRLPRSGHAARAPARGRRRRRGVRRAALDQAALRLGLPRLPGGHRQHRGPARAVPPRPPEGVVELRRPTSRCAGCRRPPTSPGAPTRRPRPLLATSWTLGLASFNDRLLSLTPLKTHTRRRAGLRHHAARPRTASSGPTRRRRTSSACRSSSCRSASPPTRSTTSSPAGSTLIDLLADAGYDAHAQPGRAPARAGRRRPLRRHRPHAPLAEHRRAERVEPAVRRARTWSSPTPAASPPTPRRTRP